MNFKAARAYEELNWRRDNGNISDTSTIVTIVITKKSAEQTCSFIY